MHISGLLWTSILLSELTDFPAKTMTLFQCAASKKHTLLKCKPALANLLLLGYAKLNDNKTKSCAEQDGVFSCLFDFFKKFLLSYKILKTSLLLINRQIVIFYV